MIMQFILLNKNDIIDSYTKTTPKKHELILNAVYLGNTFLFCFQKMEFREGRSLWDVCQDLGTHLLEAPFKNLEILIGQMY